MTERYRFRLTFPWALLIVLLFLFPGCGDPQVEAPAEVSAPLLSLFDRDGQPVAPDAPLQWFVADTTLGILYDDRLDAASFGADLNGHDVTWLFDPVPAGREILDLEDHMRPAINYLRLTAGSLDDPGRVESHEVVLTPRAVKGVPLFVELIEDVMPPPPPHIPGQPEEQGSSRDPLHREPAGDASLPRAWAVGS